MCGCLRIFEGTLGRRQRRSALRTVCAMVLQLGSFSELHGSLQDDRSLVDGCSDDKVFVLPVGLAL